MTRRDRFAPSPTGPLHLGHAYSAIMAHDAARAAGGAFLLRIEDIDRARSRPAWEAQIYDDLAWLGLTWERPVMRQSDRLDAYRAAITQLDERGLIYSCNCNRRDILAANTAPQEGAASFGPDGLIYPGTCRHRRGIHEGMALRLDTAAAIAQLPVPFLSNHETGQGQDTLMSLEVAKLPEALGDFVIARKDMATSYHLAVVLDDDAQGITHVTRGEDLMDATAIHVLLQALLGLHTPIYHHHKLIRDEDGKRLAKRDDARAIAKYRADGMSPDELRALIF